MYYIYKETNENGSLNLKEVRCFKPRIIDGVEFNATDLFLFFIEHELKFDLKADNSFMGYWVYRCDKFKDELHEVCIDIFETATNNAQLEFCGYVLTNYKIEL